MDEETTDSDLDTYWSPKEILSDAAARISDILASVRIEGVYGVIALGMYDVMNDTDLLDVRSVGSKTSCSGIVSFAAECMKDGLMSGWTIVQGDIGDDSEDDCEEIGA